MNLKDFALMKEDENSYTIGHPQGKSMMIPKKGLSDTAMKLISKLKKHQNYAEGTPDGTDEDEDSNESPALPINVNNPQMPASMINPNVDAADEQTATGQEPQNTNQSESEQTENVPTQSTTPIQSTTTTPFASPDLQKGLEEAKKTSLRAVGAETTAGKQAQSAQSQLATDLESQKKSYDQIMQDHQAKDKAGYQAVANLPPIDQDRYWSNKSALSKAATSIGVFLGGIGAGITGGPNMPLQMLRQNIQQDIESQKNDQSKAMNLWEMNKQATGSDQQAELASENQLYNIAKAKTQAALSGAMGPEAAQRAVQLNMGIDNQIAQNNWMRSRLSNGTPGTEQQHIAELQVMQQLRPDLYKDMQSKYLPGTGVASIPVAPADRETVKAYDDIQKAVNDAKAFENTQAGIESALPFTALNAEAQSKKNAIALGLNKLNGLNRLNEIEYNQFMKSVDGIGSPRTGRSNAQLDELSNQIQRKKQALMRNLGIQPFRQAASNQQAIAWARANPNDPRAAQIMKLAGG